MGAIFLHLFNMSITAGWLVLAIVIVRLLFRNMPKTIRCVLWALVAIRLICPVAIESDVSLVPSAETIPQHNLYSSKPTINSGIYAINSAVNPIISGDAMVNDEFHLSKGTTENIVAQAVDVASYIWMAGVVIVLVYAVFSYMRLRRKVQASIKIQSNIYICDNIDTPFILGIIRPRIYLPSYLTELERECVIAHEQAHIRRRDHWWKPLGFMLLTVYWFNPLMWAAYILLCRDIELACDERVIKDMDNDFKKQYSEVLLSCATTHRMVIVTPLAFGEVAVKSRIKSVLSYKKPAFWVLVVGCIVCAILTVGFLTNPVKIDKTEKQDTTYQKGNIIETYNCSYKNVDIMSTAYLWLDYEDNICGFAPMIEMSYMTQGKFVMDGDKIVITSRGGDTYTFRMVADGLEYEGFNGEHNELGKLPKGAIFELKDVTDKSNISEGDNSYIEEETSDDEENLYASTYIYYGAGDSILGPQFMLHEADNTFSCTCSPLSSFMIFGEYELTDERLVLGVQEGSVYKYIFKRVGDKFVFDADISSEFPGFGAGSVASAPVPDGAIFELYREANN